MSSLTEQQNEKNKEVDIEITIDRSGSMSSQGDAPTTGLYEFLLQQKENATGLTSVSLTTFDDSVEYPWKVDDIKKDPLPDKDTMSIWIEPRGSTRLIDTAIERLKAQKDRAGDKKRIFVLLTDGQDNVSRNRTPQMNKALREARSAGVACIFLGSNQDAITCGQQYGFSPDLCLSTSSAPERAAIGYRACSQVVTRAINSDPLTSVGFTGTERNMSAPDVLITDTVCTRPLSTHRNLTMSQPY